MIAKVGTEQLRILRVAEAQESGDEAYMLDGYPIRHYIGPYPASPEVLVVNISTHGHSPYEVCCNFPGTATLHVHSADREGNALDISKEYRRN